MTKHTDSLQPNDVHLGSVWWMEVKLQPGLWLAETVSVKAWIGYLCEVGGFISWNWDAQEKSTRGCCWKDNDWAVKRKVNNIFILLNKQINIIIHNTYQINNIFAYIKL